MKTTELWTEKYSPVSLEEFVGNSEIVKEVQLWALDWNKKKNGKPLLLYGHVGNGKTCLAHLIASLNQWDLFELNASDFRTKDIIERLAGAALQNASFSGKSRLVLLDEIDGIQARKDKGGMSAILQVLKNAKNPVILTANDIYSNRQMAIVRNYCKKLEFKKINYLSVAKRLKLVCEKESIEYDVPTINALAKESGGDLRAALLDLQSLVGKTKKITLPDVEGLGFREREEKIFSVLSKIFRAKTIKECQDARWSSEVSNDLLLRWIEENIPIQFKDPKHMASAWERFSKADIFNGRIIRRQYWGFLRYSSELMTSGVSFAPEGERKHEFVMYRFPTLLSKLSAASSERALKKQVAQKMQKKLHASKREIISQDIPFLMALFEKEQAAIGFTANFGFDEKELAFLLQTTSKTKKVQSILEQAQELSQKNRKAKRKPLEAVQEQDLSAFEAPKEENPVPLAEAKGQSKLF
ncbi:replication factor C large subunit [Candidatus Micrarchaeota archaeon]|nr:replication factor C large subunit [Candidatus Micrarchaeota archaeon]MBU1930149.1 replication factor C large subunit [Candidatus Micrarchaeota archaeon]